ncbi:MAG TPA: class I SAM-dependent methyltransferase [Spirochaetota bacterium]|nr:class I SAM-dependent methyltransferase [Spirochaetota bacterium]HNT11669.1 class I SAM-dependent methyltransferase [Spirochaetota bacterium]
MPNDTVFKDYSRYYDLLYRDKDYGAEAGYIDTLIRRYANGPVRRVLDIGCGTGVHASLLAARGYEVDGVDLSTDMIAIARTRGRDNLRFHVGDAVAFRLGWTFDVVVSLFHVVNYQTTNEGLAEYFENIIRHLEPGGTFIFDFWYGPAVLTQRPETRVKRLSDEHLGITRIAESDLLVNENRVNVNYEIQVENRKTGERHVIRETHPVRYLFLPEVLHYVGQAGGRILRTEEWLTGQEPGTSSWGVCAIGTKA